jgi:DNA-binding IclR family transcriptional regulator
VTRGNPSVQRAEQVLTLLGTAPERGFTLADIVRRTGLSKATVHALLATLVDCRWLLRHPIGPSYRLGPGLITLGEAARRGHPALSYAQEPMHELGLQLELGVLASAVIDDEIVILGKAGVAAPVATTGGIGQRVPLVPPLATVFFAWAGEEVVRAAFGGAELTATYRSALAAVRERGYAVGLENPVRERLGRTFAAQWARGELDPQAITGLVSALADEDYQLVEESGGAAAGDEAYWLNHLAAPIFDVTGGVVLALTLVGFAAPVDLAEIHRLGALLRATADGVTAQLHGRLPARPTLPAPGNFSASDALSGPVFPPQGGVAVPW